MPSVVRASAKSGRRLDPTVYPVEEKVGEDMLQRWIAELLRPLVERWFKHRRVRAFAGADQFIYYRQHTPTERLSPDIYVLPGLPADTRVTSWKIWETGIVPSFGLEIVSKDWLKDYAEAPERYAHAGVPELVVFDPAPERHPERVTWQVFRRVRGRPLVRVEVSRGDRVRSVALRCFLRAVGSGNALRLRLGTGPHGDELFPTGEEAALARVAELEAQLRKRRPRSR
jgi:Uma2 family endonuclease